MLSEGSRLICPVSWYCLHLGITFFLGKDLMKFFTLWIEQSWYIYISTKGKSHIIYKPVVVKLYCNLESSCRPHLQSWSWLVELQLSYLFSRKQNGGRNGKGCVLSLKETTQKFHVTFLLTSHSLKLSSLGFT